jgi:adenylate cyclase
MNQAKPEQMPDKGTAFEREPVPAWEAVQRLRRYIPSAVAEGVLHDQQRLRGERREVAVLFADAVDFTRLTASLDAEPVFKLINDLLGRLMACVDRYDGMVDKLTGDGLMAIFGAPVAHENDAELAVRAALDMQKAAAAFEPIARTQLGAPVRIRIGIHSGPAIAGILGTQQQAAYTVIGETVNLASRLEAEARAGHVLVSTRVYQQTRALFNYQSVGLAHLKGLDEPVAVHEVVGDRSQPLPTRGVVGVATTILGRDAELEGLRNLLAAFVQDKRGRLVVVQGEAGLGKSRLVNESVSALDTDKLFLYQGRGLPYAQGIGYGVFRSLLQDAVRAQRDVRQWDADVSPSLRPFLRRILGTRLTADAQAALPSLEPERVKQLTALALREWLTGEARRRPVIVVLEDFHWADDVSRDLWKLLVNLTEEMPILLIVISRPQTQSVFPLDGPASPEPLAAPLSLSLNLEPLSAEDSRALLGHLVDLESLPEELVEIMLTRAEGNPLYIEEFVRMLIEKEILTLGEGRWHVTSTLAVAELDIPTSLRGLMMARVDRLPEGLQHLLRTAAVVGLQFSASLLEKVEQRMGTGDRVAPKLQRLVDLGVLVERPQAGEQVYAFRHLLTQETIYSSLMRSQRPAMHHTVAECIEELHAENLSEQADVLALHYDRARVRSKAMVYSLEAGDRARERFANTKAVEYYGRALQLSQHLADCQHERWRAAVGLGEVQQHVGEYEEAIACYQAALDEGADVAVTEKGRVMLRLGQVWGDKRGDLDEAERWLTQALARLERTSTEIPELYAQLYSELGWLSLRRGNFRLAQERLEHGLDLVKDTKHYDVLSSILNRLGYLHYSRGEWGPAVDSVARALEFRERLGDIVGYARSLNNLAILKQLSGDWDGALADFEHSVATHERIGGVEGVILACTNLGVLYTERGDWERAAQNLLRSFKLARRIEHPYQLALAHMNLGRLYLLQEYWEDAARHVQAAIPLYLEAGADADLTLYEVYNLQGRLLLERGRAQEAAEWAQRSYDLLRDVTGEDENDSSEWGRYRRLLGRIAFKNGDLSTAQRHFERAAAIFQAVGTHIEAGRTAFWIGVVALDLHEPGRAQKAFLSAKAVFEQLGAAADLQKVDEQLARLRAPG